MNELDLELLNDIYKSKDGSHMRNSVARFLQKNIAGKSVLMVGLVRPYIDMFDNCNDIHYIDYQKSNICDNEQSTKKKFDIIIVSHLIEFSPRLHDAFKQISNILDGNGTAIIIVANKNFRHIDCRSTSEIVSHVFKCNSLKMKEIVGISRYIKVWPYDFHLHLSQHNYFLLPLMPFWSDITIIKMKKLEPKIVPTFIENYGIANG